MKQLRVVSVNSPKEFEKEVNRVIREEKLEVHFIQVVGTVTAYIFCEKRSSDDEAERIRFARRYDPDPKVALCAHDALTLLKEPDPTQLIAYCSTCNSRWQFAWTGASCIKDLLDYRAEVRTHVAGVVPPRVVVYNGPCVIDADSNVSENGIAIMPVENKEQASAIIAAGAEMGKKNMRLSNVLVMERTDA